MAYDTWPAVHDFRRLACNTTSGEWHMAYGAMWHTRTASGLWQLGYAARHTMQGIQRETHGAWRLAHD
eukprot:1099108-Lingulodinium_polyedra.AAC.1